MKKKLEKPEKQTKTFYDYNKCRNYLQEKYRYEERDYAGKFSSKWKKDSEVPYQDFWHWVLDNHDVHNGCYIVFSREQYNEIQEDWVKKIYNYYMDEFAEKDELEMYVWW